MVARNERRARQGKEPLDVEQEVERQLRDLENLGQASEIRIAPDARTSRRTRSSKSTSCWCGPGTYFNPQTEIVVVVDDSTSIDQEIFNMEAYEGSDWVRISDDVPVDEDGLDVDARGVPDHYHGGTPGLALRDRGRAGRRHRRRGGRQLEQDPGRED